MVIKGRIGWKNVNIHTHKRGGREIKLCELSPRVLVTLELSCALQDGWEGESPPSPPSCSQ